jgi:hypothetical protein
MCSETPDLLTSSWPLGIVTSLWGFRYHTAGIFLDVFRFYSAPLPENFFLEFRNLRARFWSLPIFLGGSASPGRRAARETAKAADDGFCRIGHTLGGFWQNYPQRRPAPQVG